jgi:hypothetical protein
VMFVCNPYVYTPYMYIRIEAVDDTPQFKVLTRRVCRGVQEIEPQRSSTGLPTFAALRAVQTGLECTSYVTSYVYLLVYYVLDVIHV